MQHRFLSHDLRQYGEDLPQLTFESPQMSASGHVFRTSTDITKLFDNMFEPDKFFSNPTLQTAASTQQTLPCLSESGEQGIEKFRIRTPATMPRLAHVSLYPDLDSRYPTWTSSECTYTRSLAFSCSAGLPAPRQRQPPE